MSVPLRDLIEEWEAINHDLFKASLESHRRYPFPSHLFDSDAETTAAGPSPSSDPASPEASTAAYARVYRLVSRVRYIAEDARYNSFYILQHLLWVTIVAWANQLAVASGGRIKLPANVQRLLFADDSAAPSGSEDSRGGAAKSSSSSRTTFSCSLLPPLTWWDPQKLAAAVGGSSADKVFASDAAHQAPNLPRVWKDAVRRILDVWCTPTSNPSLLENACGAKAVNSGGNNAAAATAPSCSRTRMSISHLDDAYLWVLFAQHYHRFKAILSLFLLRYDAHLEDLEEQQQQQQHRRQRRHPMPPTDGADTTERPSSYPNPALLLRRRAPHYGVNSDLTAAAALLSSAATPPGPAPTPTTTQREKKPPTPLPTTARLLALIMRNVETANIDVITAATGEAVIFLLMPPAHRARLREKVLQAQKLQASAADGKQGGQEAESGAQEPPAKSTTLTEPETLASAFLDGCAPEEEEEDGDDDKVVWSAPPSPLLTFTKFSVLPPNVSLTPVDESLPQRQQHPSSPPRQQQQQLEQQLQPLGRAQKEEYVIRNVFKLLLMAEDCRVYALQHWLVEVGKHVVAVYGAQLASLFFEEPPADSSADGGAASNRTSSNNHHTRNSSSDAAEQGPALTVHTLADANRVLRETLQSYVRLRTKLLFLNAGTTHFLEALTPWGRTRMLENLNAFLCGFCGLTLPTTTTTEDSEESPGVSSPSPSPSTGGTFNAAQYFTPTNAAVAAFTRTWGVPLWLAMCDDTQRRLEALQAAKQKREEQRKVNGGLHRTKPIAVDHALAEEEEGDDVDEGEVQAAQRGTGAATFLSHFPDDDDDAAGLSPNAQSPVRSGKYVKEAETRSATEGRDHSVVSGDLADAVSRAPSGMWPPPSPTTGRAGGHGVGVGSGAAGAHDFSRVRGRGLDLKRVLQQQQQRRRNSAGPAPPRQQEQLQPHNVPGNGSDQRRSFMEEGVGHALESDGGGGLEESLYSAETYSVGDISSSQNNNNNNAGAGNYSGSRVNGQGDAAAARQGDLLNEADVEDSNAPGYAGLVAANSVDAAVAAARQRRRRAAAAAAAQGPGGLFAPQGTTQRFSRAAQLHQVATLPDEGFPSLLYLVPRRSRFVAQDKAAAAVQQELFTRFSSDVHNYLATFLSECEAEGNAAVADTNKQPKQQQQPNTSEKPEPSAASATGSVRKTKKKPKESVASRPPGEGEVRPLPQPVLARMIFLLDMTYAALQGSGVADPSHGHAAKPVMETGLTATGQEQGAAILEQDNGEFESVVSTTLSAPTSPAVLTIAAVRKGFQGFLATQDKRAVLTLAQAFYALVQEGLARQPPAVALEAVDTILNMASLLNSKDVFVALLKGYIAPQVMMCRAIGDITVESQVVARMAYRLGSAVAAPCLTLLRDLRLAMADPLLSPSGAVTGVDEGYGGYGERGAAGAVFEGAMRTDMTAEGSQLMATRDAQTLAAAGPLRHGLFGLIHRMRVLCQAWWQPHTAVLLSSRRLQRLWERYQLMDEAVVDAVLRVEWRYDGHTEPFYGYGRIPGDVEAAALLPYADDGAKGGGGRHRHSRSSVSDGGFGASSNSRASHHSPSQHLSGGNRNVSPRHHRQDPRSSASTTTGSTRRNGAAAAVIQGFSSVLGSAVRRTGHHAGAFGNNESDNESEDYSEAYGGLLTLSTLQRHRGSYAPSTSSYRGSNMSSIGGGGGGTGATGEFYDLSDGGQSHTQDDAASTTVPPDGELERRQLRWPLGDGQLVFLLFSRNAPAAARAAASQAVQISGPPLTLLVCQLMDRAADTPYTFDRLHKALPVQTPKPLLAHLLHELVKAGVVTRSVPPGTRQYIYQLRDDVQKVQQRKVIVDVRAAAQQQWVTRTLTAAESDGGEDTERASQRDPMSPASPAGVGPAFPTKAAAATAGAPPPRDDTHARSTAAAVSGPAEAPGGSRAEAATSGEHHTSPAYSVERTHKVKVCIVRIMKSERVLTHRELLERVSVALEDQFVVTPGQFKRCVAHLIEKEFLQRSEGGEEYMYLS